jgi:hypothetical protein
VETIAIIPLGPLTIPSIRKLLISSPGLPEGRFGCEPPPPPVSFPRSGAKGSRREILSRTATGLIVGTPAGVGTSDFATVSGFEVEGFAVGLAVTPEGTLPAETVAGLALLTVPSAGFDPDATVDAGFAAGVLAGLAVVFVAALAGELEVEPTVELDAAVGAGLVTELVVGAGFGVCACFAAEAPVEA